MFWFLVAKVSGSGSVGLASTIVSLMMIITTISGMDLFIGMKRSLTKFYTEGDKSKYSGIFISVFTFLTLSASVASVALVYPINILDLIGIDDQYYWVVVVSIYLLSYHYLFTETFISIMNTKEFFKFILLGSLLRFPLFGISLVLLGQQDLSPIMAYYSMYAVTVALSSFYVVRKFTFKISSKQILSHLKSIASISTSSWIPNIINVSGFWLGVVIVFSINGAQDGGKFYISVGIFSVVLFIVTGISKVTHGVIQNIEKDKQLKFLSYSIKIAIVFTIPISASIMFFSSSFLVLLGTEFTSSSLNLSILMVSTPFVIVSELIYYYLYGLSFHREVLVLGLMGNVPRMFLYFLISLYINWEYASLGYFVGSVLQCIFSFPISRINHRLLDIREKVFVSSIPFAIGFLLWVANIPYYYSIAVIFLTSFGVYIRLGLFNDSDLHRIVYGIMPKYIGDIIYNILIKFVRIIQK